MKLPRVSIVVPIFNEAKILLELTRRISDVLADCPEIDWEVLYVDDGSTDDSPLILERLADKHSWLRVIFLSRNFGHQTAITAGIDHASGDAVILMDGDLQDPPELIPGMLNIWQQGFEVVTARRRRRGGESWFKLATAYLFYRTLRFLSDTPIPVDTGDFRLMSKPVVEALKRMPERSRFLRGMVSWTGFRQTEIEYEREERKAGKTKFTLLKMIRFAANGILSFSHVPLQATMILGLFFLLAAFIGSVAVLYDALVLKSTLRGWITLMTGVVFIGGIQLVCLGAIGSYVGRIFDEVRARPLYFVRNVKRRTLANQSPIQFARLDSDDSKLKYNTL